MERARFPRLTPLLKPLLKTSPSRSSSTNTPFKASSTPVSPSNYNFIKIFYSVSSKVSSTALIAVSPLAPVLVY